MEGIHWDDIYVFYWNILLCFLFIFKLKDCLIWKSLILRDFKTIIWKLETFLDLNHEYLSYTEYDLRTADIFKGGIRPVFVQSLNIHLLCGLNTHAKICF